MLLLNDLIQFPKGSILAEIMIEDEALSDLIHAVAQAVILFGPIADCRLEFTASDIANRLNPERESRQNRNVVYEADLEAGFGRIDYSNVSC